MSKYKTNPRGLIRDECYPSVIAADRPKLAPRLVWESENEAHGSTSAGDGENRCELFNRQLRGGHAGRNDGDE